MQPERETLSKLVGCGERSKSNGRDPLLCRQIANGWKVVFRGVTGTEKNGSTPPGPSSVPYKRPIPGLLTSSRTWQMLEMLL